MFTQIVDDKTLFIPYYTFCVCNDNYFMICISLSWIFACWSKNWAGWTNGSKRDRSQFYWIRNEILSPDNLIGEINRSKIVGCSEEIQEESKELEPEIISINSEPSSIETIYLDTL
jgi:hypothetical protein